MLNTRSSENEQLDNLDLSGDELTRALDGLSTINKYLGNTSVTFQAVKRELLKSDKSLKIIDLGCGAGDNLRAIENWCHKTKRPVELLGIDGNAHSLEYAQKQNKAGSAISFLLADILDPDFVLPNCDILISSHFMYHFSDDAIVAFLKKSKENISHKIIFSELQRSSLAYILFNATSVFLPFSKIVKEDGLIALRRAFAKKELISIVERAGFADYEIKGKWAFRFLVTVSSKG
jgi:2-polyprenyl-3-methyl-5-hydroxy-6-metoxy-1,4-benzoquinol methylase